VLSTLHSIDAPQSTDRIIDMFPPNQQQQIRLQLSQVLEAVLSQTLLPRISGGRIAAIEIMLCSPVIRELIRAAKIYDISTHMEICNIDGMQTLDQALAGLVRRGIVRLEDALVKSSNPATLKKLLTAKVSVF
jgi:twitching motility protein PilT